MKLQFISGLPRSGSTLLAALLRQNPRFYHAGMSSPVAQIIMKLQQATSRGSEGAVLIEEHQRKRLLRGIFANYYASAKAEIVFDTNRAWTAKMSLLAELFPNSKVICLVRDVPWVMNSVEKLIQSNPTELSGLFGYNANTTVFGRIAGLAAADGLVGYAMNALREAFCGAFADRLILLDYEALTKDPAAAMKILYEFIGEPLFDHDFENFDFEAQEFDLSLGTPGLHKVRGPVRWEPQNFILPPELMNQFANDSFWRNQENNLRGVPVIMWDRTPRETPREIQPPQTPQRPQLRRA